MPYLYSSTLAYPANSYLPGLIWQDVRDPTSGDFRNFNVGTFWINSQASKAWLMVDKTSSSGTWIQLASTGTGILDITGNTGGAIPPDMSNNINLIGSSPLTVSGNSGTNTLTISQNGTVSTSFPTDSGTGIPSAGALQLLGGTGVTTSALGNVVTISSTTSSALNFTCNSGSAVPSLNNLNVFGSGGTTTTGSGATITITTSGSGITWNQITVVGPTTMLVNNGYITNSVSQVLLKLPTTAAVGSELIIVGKGSGGWQIQQSAGQTIYFGAVNTTTGATGTLTSTQQRDSVTLVCTTADLDFDVISSVGNITYV